MSEERQAVFYGKVELIPGVICDGYVLDNGTAVMSERGTADLLGMDQKTLNAMRGNWPPKTLESFVDVGFTMRTNLVEVVANNSPYQGRKIVVYSAETIQTLISAYALAFAHDALRENQKHIGKRCTILAVSLIRTALEAAIREACGLPLNIQQTVQRHVDAVQLAVELGLKSSISRDGREFVTVKDLAKFAGVKLSKIRYYAKKHREHLNPIALNRWERQVLGGRATHLKAYPLDEAVRVMLSMDSVTGIELKDKLFGAVGILAKPDTREEIQWAAKLSTAFDGQDFHHNFPLGSYRVDFFIGSFKVVLECNGFEHRYYNAEKERAREQFITRDYGLVRFDHTTSLEKLINAILQVKPGEIIRLFDSDVLQRMVV